MEQGNNIKEENRMGQGLKGKGKKPSVTGSNSITRTPKKQQIRLNVQRLHAFKKYTISYYHTNKRCVCLGLRMARAKVKYYLMKKNKKKNPQLPRTHVVC